MKSTLTIDMIYPEENHENVIETLACLQSGMDYRGMDNPVLIFLYELLNEIRVTGSVYKDFQFELTWPNELLREDGVLVTTHDQRSLINNLMDAGKNSLEVLEEQEEKFGGRSMGYITNPTRKRMVKPETE